MRNHPKILLLDDEPLARLMASMTLKRHGALVSEADCCEEARRLALATDFDAAVFDYRLPDGDGVGLVRALRARGVGFPVVLLTGEVADVAREVEDGLGILDVLEKPLEPERLLAALAETLETPEEGVPATCGRYRVCRAGQEPPVPGADELLAIDFTEWSEAALPASVGGMERPARGALAIVGASAAIQAAFADWSGLVDFVADYDELASLSRRPCSPSERASLLGGDLV